MFTLASLWIPFTVTAALGQVARNAMQRSLTGPLGTWGATNIRFLFGFPFSMIFLAVAVARSAEPDRRDRHDAGRHERPLLRGHDGVSENRGDPDRDLRFRLPR